MSRPVHIVVVGSVNLDLTARVPALPRAGETVTDGVLSSFPGGKGANQALAARRLGADVTLIACVGQDANADAALALLREEGVDLTRLAVSDNAATGVALIAVDAKGENQIVVAPGANRCLDEAHLDLPGADALICQLEVPPATMHAAVRRFAGFVTLNLAPIVTIPEEAISEADLVVVNEIEAEHFAARLAASDVLVALTHGSRGAELRRGNDVLARQAPPQVTPVDTTGAGDTFTAALTVALAEGRDYAAALAFACAAAAASTEQPGAQPAMPDRARVEALLAG